ncbi:hypothetical protein N6H14_26760 [Paenibacillus sp. CC-CFT747]|nr:hypothetical protein N6H14_26760 [Paenibacillus sp. CC-CFT747]
MIKKSNPNRFVTARVLREVARAMLPFYQAIALNKDYATRWGRAVITLNVTEMLRLFRLVSLLPRSRFPAHSRAGIR